MKKEMYFFVMLVVLSTLLPFGTLAQIEVTYPSSRYLNWQLNPNFTSVGYGYLGENPLGASYYISHELDHLETDTGVSRERTLERIAYDLERTWSQSFNYHKADTNTTYTIYGVAIPLTTYTDREPELHLDRPVDTFVSFDIVVYSGREGDTSVTLETRETFSVCSEWSPSVRMQFPESRTFGMYEFYFKQPITVTGLFFVGIGQNYAQKPVFYARELQAYPKVYPYEGYSFPQAYWEVCVRNDSVVESYASGYTSHTDGVVDYHHLYPTAPPDVERAVPLPDIDLYIPTYHVKFGLYRTQSFYPILQPRDLGVSEVEKSGQVHVAPNPATERVSITSSSPIRGYTVMDIAGRIVLSGHAGAETLVTVDIQALPKGVYTVLVETEQGRHMQKMVKR